MIRGTSSGRITLMLRYGTMPYYTQSSDSRHFSILLVTRRGRSRAFYNTTIKRSLCSSNR
jgi:hypothetical protein